MIQYPYSYPIILNDAIYSQYGGKGTGTFSQFQLQAAYLIAETQASNYIGTFLLPTIVTGTYPTVPTYTQRIATDVGYVSQLLGVVVKSKKNTYADCTLVDVAGCGFIYNDTYGYLDIRRVNNVCGCGNNSTWAIPYLYQISYEAGLPTGVATHPAVLMAMTIAAQITLNEMFPGVVGVNESVGDSGIQEYESFTYHERRTAHSLKRTAFGQSAMASKAAQLIDSAVKKCRKSLRI